MKKTLRNKAERQSFSRKVVTFKILTTFSPLLKKQPPEVFCKKSIFKNFAKFTGK